MRERVPGQQNVHFLQESYEINKTDEEDDLYICQGNPRFTQTNIKWQTKEFFPTYIFLNRHTFYNNIFKIDYKVSQMKISPTLTHEDTEVTILKDDYKKVVNQYKKTIIFKNKIFMVTFKLWFDPSICLKCIV